MGSMRPRVRDIKVIAVSIGRSAGVPPAVAGASRSRAKIKPNRLIGKLDVSRT